MKYEIDIDGSCGYKCIVLKENLKQKHIKSIEKRGFNAVRLSDSAGCNVTNLSILKDMPFLKCVEIYQSGDKIDLSPLKELDCLEMFRTDTVPNKEFDLSELDNLKILFINWHKNFLGLEKMGNIIHLNIGKFPEQNLKMLHGMKNLEHLQVDSRKLTSLKGIEAFKNLKTLDIFCCFQLQNIDDIVVSKNLEKIEITTCKKLNSFPKFNFFKLKRLLIENCGEIESLNFLSQQEALEEFYFIASSIADNDVSILNKIKNLKDLALPLKYSRMLKKIHSGSSRRGSLAGSAMACKVYAVSFF